jgi:hypothetical protein
LIGRCVKGAGRPVAKGHPYQKARDVSFIIVAAPADDPFDCGGWAICITPSGNRIGSNTYRVARGYRHGGVELHAMDAAIAHLPLMASPARTPAEFNRPHKISPQYIASCMGHHV